MCVPLQEPSTLFPRIGLNKQNLIDNRFSAISLRELIFLTIDSKRTSIVQCNHQKKQMSMINLNNVGI